MSYTKTENGWQADPVKIMIFLVECGTIRASQDWRSITSKHSDCSHRVRQVPPILRTPC